MPTHRKQYTVPKIPRHIITYLILRREFKQSTTQKLLRFIYRTYIISRIAANLVLHLFAQWIIPPIIIDLIRWLYGPPSDPADAHASSQATGLWYSIQQRQYCFNQDFANSSTNHTEEGDEPAHDGSSNRSQGNESHTVLWYQNHQEIQAHASITSTSAAHKVHFDTDSFLIGVELRLPNAFHPIPTILRISYQSQTNSVKVLKVRKPKSKAQELSYSTWRTITVLFTQYASRTAYTFQPQLKYYWYPSTGPKKRTIPLHFDMEQCAKL